LLHVTIIMNGILGWDGIRFLVLFDVVLQVGVYIQVLCR